MPVSYRESRDVKIKPLEEKINDLLLADAILAHYFSADTLIRQTIIQYVKDTKNELSRLNTSTRT